MGGKASDVLSIILYRSLRAVVIEWPSSTGLPMVLYLKQTQVSRSSIKFYIKKNNVIFLLEATCCPQHLLWGTTLHKINHDNSVWTTISLHKYQLGWLKFELQWVWCYHSGLHGKHSHLNEVFHIVVVQNWGKNKIEDQGRGEGRAPSHPLPSPILLFFSSLARSPKFHVVRMCQNLFVVPHSLGKDCYAGY